MAIVVDLWVDGNDDQVGGMVKVVRQSGGLGWPLTLRGPIEFRGTTSTFP